MVSFSKIGIESFWVRFLSEVQTAYASQKGVNASDPVWQGLGEGISALQRAASAFPVLSANPANDVRPNWINFAVNELSGFNAYGPGAIGSLSEAVVKTQTIVNLWQSNPKGRALIFFRGQTAFDWSLTPRITRTLGCSHDSENLCGVTEAELNALGQFQGRVASDDGLRKQLTAGADLPPKDSPEWWELMQHYDESGGTRMLDITSSIFCGLYFACAGWTGCVNEKQDGALYFLPSPPGRGEKVKPKRDKNGDLQDFNDEEMTTAASYFNVETAVDTIRFRRARGRNPRLLAQDGYFLWQPRFAEELVVGQHFKFRVPGTAKARILRELYSAGYTAERIVRGKPARIAHGRLTAQLGLPTDA